MELLNSKMQLILRNGMQPRKQLIRKRQRMIKRKRQIPKPKQNPLLNQQKQNLNKLSLLHKKMPRHPPLQSKLLKQRLRQLNAPPLEKTPMIAKLLKPP